VEVEVTGLIHLDMNYQLEKRDMRNLKQSSSAMLCEKRTTALYNAKEIYELFFQMVLLPPTRMGGA
jgi:hypothetical protein